LNNQTGAVFIGCASLFVLEDWRCLQIRLATVQRRRKVTGMNKRVILNAIMAVCASVSVSQAQLITNGGFEEYLGGWNFSGAVDVVQYRPDQPKDGTNFARFNAAEATPNAVLSQSFPSVPGERYELQFKFGSWSEMGNSEQRLSVVVSGSGILLSNTVIAQGVSGILSMVPHHFYFLADSTTSTLTFRDVSLQTWSTDGHLDHVAVEWVGPALSIRASQAELCWDSKTSQVYQVQYRSALTTDIWTDLGSPIPGNSPTTCVYDTITPGMPQRFYRVILAP
jgi:hypothetical protein